MSIQWIAVVVVIGWLMGVFVNDLMMPYLNYRMHLKDGNYQCIAPYTFSKLNSRVALTQSCFAFVQIWAAHFEVHLYTNLD